MPPRTDTAPDINYALVETTRPAMYRAMKYWGKKPHNIWAQYIERYCPPGGLVADPFAGSAVAAFEAVKAGRKAIAFDLNPLTSFIIEVTASRWDREAFTSAATQIRDAVAQTAVYRSHYCRTVAGKSATVLNYRWEDGRVIGVATESDDGTRALTDAGTTDRKLAGQIPAIRMDHWHPVSPFPSHPSITHRFLDGAGGRTIDHLWTRRNLYLLAELFNHILRMPAGPVKLQLLSGFIQALHLCSKMVIPRHEEAHRDYSGSWGRPDYLIRRRQMEQNPVDVFWRSCTGHQGVTGMMQNAAETFPNGLQIHDAQAASKLRAAADINYGAIDVADLGDYVRPKTIDFIITDPPYAGLVRYLPLSVVWLSWLEKIDRKYKPDLRAEITVNRSPGSREAYRGRLRNAFELMHAVLRDPGRLVVTFHHQDVREFNDFVLSVKEAGFVIDKVTHQYNLRSGESNVANPYGVSGSDFYVRCVKRRDIDFTGNPAELGSFIVQKAIQIIGSRNEPTPYNFLFEALWPELLQAGFTQPADSRNEIMRLLHQNEGSAKIFTRTPRPTSLTGDLWWFSNPPKYINHPDRPLQDRVSDSVLAYLRRKVSVKLDDVLGDLFREYPNGLTPDPRTVRSFLERYAHKAQGKWKIDPEMIVAVTKHSDTIASILKIGEKLGAHRFVGKREQPERTTLNHCLRDLADIASLSALSKVIGRGSIERLEMVDVVFAELDTPALICLWEVENSTNFSSAICRGSNAPQTVPKFMVIPPEREQELRRIRDPLFVESFAANRWSYLTYDDVTRLSGRSRLSLDIIRRSARSLDGGS